MLAQLLLVQAVALQQGREDDHERQRRLVRAHRHAPPGAARAVPATTRRSPRAPIYTSRVVTVRFTFSRSESRRAMAYLALRNRAGVAMGLLGLALLAAGVGSAKTPLLLVGIAELAAWVVLVVVLPRVGSAWHGGTGLRADA